MLDKHLLPELGVEDQLATARRVAEALGPSLRLLAAPFMLTRVPTVDIAEWDAPPDDPETAPTQPAPNEEVATKLRSTSTRFESWLGRASTTPSAAPDNQLELATQFAVTAARIPGVAEVRLGRRGDALAMALSAHRDWWEVVELLEPLLLGLRRHAVPFDYEVVPAARANTYAGDLSVVFDRR